MVKSQLKMLSQQEQEQEKYCDHDSSLDILQSIDGIIREFCRQVVKSK